MRSKCLCPSTSTPLKAKKDIVEQQNMEESDSPGDYEDVEPHGSGIRLSQEEYRVWRQRSR
jgi:hypothetical protein